MTSHRLSPPRATIRGRWLGFAAALAVAFAGGVDGAATPDAARLLPPETVLVISSPSFPKAVAAFTNLPTARLWQDSTLRGPEERLIQWWREEVLTPMDRYWHFSLAEWADCTRGQITFALIREGKSRDWVLITDAGDRGSNLAANVAVLQKAWVEAKRNLRTELVQGREVAVLLLPDAYLPPEVRNALSSRPTYQESLAPQPVTPRAVTSPSVAPVNRGELCLVQAGSCLVLGSSTAAIGKVLARLERTDLPTLAKQATYTRQAEPLTREATVWGWAEARTLMDVLGITVATNALSAETLAANPEAAVFLSPGLGQLARAVGLGAMQGATFRLRAAADGVRTELRFIPQEGAPRNLLTSLAGPAADLGPPPYVPADALEYDRVRWTASTLPAALEQALDDFSPRFSSAVNFLFDTAQEAARVKDAEFNLRAHLRAGLGEELVRWDRLVGDAATGQSVRRVLVLPSPAPERTVQALRALFVLFPQQENDAKEREFLNRKIYSVPLPPMPGNAPPTEGSGTLYYAASIGQVVLATSENLVEEFLRLGETTAKPLSEVPGLKSALEQVATPSTRAAGYWDDLALARAGWATLRGKPGAGIALVPFLPVPAALGNLILGEATIPTLAENSALPAFDAVERYFHFSTYSLAVDSEGVTLRYFAPTPPALMPK